MNIFYTKFTSIYFISIWILFSSSLFAQDFKSLAAKAALKEYETAMAKAKADYVKNLEIALDKAVQNKNNEEVSIIADELTRLKGGEVKENIKAEKSKTEATKLPLGVFAILYDREDYQGKSQEIKATGRLGCPTIGGDAVRSLKVAPGYKVDLFTDSGNCTGNFISYTENTPSIDPQANSVEVTKIKK